MSVTYKWHEIERELYATVTVLASMYWKKAHLDYVDVFIFTFYSLSTYEEHTWKNFRNQNMNKK